MVSNETLDLVVLGSGPGGYVAAIRAAQLGLRVAVVEKDPQFGGTCLHRGCIPTKAWLHTAAILDQFRQAASFGIEVGGVANFDPVRAQAHRDGVVQKNAKGIEFLFRKNGVSSVQGFGRLSPQQPDGWREVEVLSDRGTERLRSRFVLLATGSAPKDLPFLPVDGKRTINSDHALRIEKVPRSIVVLGGGAVGCEFASIFCSLGAKVVLIEMLPRLVANEDEEISAELERAFRRRGIEVAVSSKLGKVDTEGGELRFEVSGPRGETTHQAEVLLVAVGRQPQTSGLGLEALGIEVSTGGTVKVNGFMETSLPGVYAIGDIVATPWLAHVASSEGILAVEHMAEQAVSPIDYELVPSCTYCEPEVASVGLTEREAIARGFEVAVGKFPFSALAKAAILGKPGGFVKVVREKRYDQLLGVHVIGAHATDLIAEACVALRLEATSEELLRTMHAHPTLSEAIAEAAHAAAGSPIHI